LFAADSGTGGNAHQQQARRRLTDAEARLRRLQGAIEEGADPAALVEAVNWAAHEERLAARADLDQLSTTRALNRARSRRSSLSWEASVPRWTEPSRPSWNSSTPHSGWRWSTTQCHVA
jgi:TolA-binding protein